MLESLIVTYLKPTPSSVFGLIVSSFVKPVSLPFQALLTFPSKRSLLFSGHASGQLSFSCVLSIQVNYKFFKGKVLVYASFLSQKPNIF